MERKPLKIFIDENIAPQLARSLDIIQEHLNKEEKTAIKVFALKDYFKQEGIKDEEWIPIIGKEHGIVITQDRKIKFSKQQRELYLQHGVGIIFLKSPKTGMSFWQMFKHIVEHWEEIKAIVRKNDPPFSFRQPGQNHKFEPWNGEE